MRGQRDETTGRLIAVPIEERFWEKVARGEPDECWLWQGRIERTGYGQITEGRKRFYAHRFSYELHHGPIPPGRNFQICHSCDVKACVNPRHLWLGTGRTNKREAIERGLIHAPKGERHHAAKFTEADVREIRRRARTEPVTQTQLAKEYGVGQPTIGDIVRRRTWVHVTD